MANLDGKAFSIRRRRLLVSTAAGALAPTSLLAGNAALPPRIAAWQTPGDDGGELVLSGRLTDADAAPLAAQTVELVQGGVVITRSRSDADGRFLIEASLATAGVRPALRVVDSDGNNRPCEQSFCDSGARFARDAAGVWRATVGITIA